MQKKIVKVTAVHMGSVHIDFEDGTMMVIHRDAAKKGVPKVGDMWPPEAVETTLTAAQEMNVPGPEDSVILLDETDREIKFETPDDPKEDEE